MAIYLDDKVMNGKKEVLQYLKLEPTAVPTTRRTELEVLGGTKDRDGNLIICKSIYGTAEYTVFVPMLGREVKVRLAKMQRPNKDKGFDYTPKNIGIEPAEDGSVLITDELEFVFWYLRPMNRQSPFRPRNSKIFYEFKDNEAKANAEAELEERMIDAMSLIYGENRKSQSELKEIAKGLNVPNVDDMSLKLIQSELGKKAKADPIGFYNSATSREIIFSGKIQNAIDLGVLEVRNINGMKRWYLSGEEILPLANGVEDDVKALKDFLATQWYLYADSIQNGLEGKTLATTLNAPENDGWFSTEHKTPEIKAEMNATLNKELKDILKEIEETPFLKEKIEKWSVIDPEDNSVHAATRKAMEKNQHYIDAYKESLKGI
jgi:hypothetical protein